jgi:hypothetical protein
MFVARQDGLQRCFATVFGFPVWCAVASVLFGDFLAAAEFFADCVQVRTGLRCDVTID